LYPQIATAKNGQNAKRYDAKIKALYVNSQYGPHDRRDSEREQDGNQDVN
jgi:hypothetical protein